ncbi:MAG: transcription termination/antitermination NusG family protein [Chitinophagaceae bacterium]
MDQHSMQWNVVFTTFHNERKVADILTKNKITNYCPLNKIYGKWSNHKKLNLEPLFESCLFVPINAELQFHVREISGIIGFLYWLGQPAVISSEEIEVIKQFVNNYTNVQLEKVPINCNETGRVVSRPVMMREEISQESNHKTLKVLLPSLGYTLIAEVDKINVQKVNSFKNAFHDLTTLQMQ